MSGPHRKSIPHLRIFQQRIYAREVLWSVDLHGGGTTRLATFHSRRGAIAAATRLCRKLHVTVRGRWSAFYRQIKRAEFEERQARVIARQRQIARPS